MCYFYLKKQVEHNMNLSFQLNNEFVESYRLLPEPFGFNGLGALTFYRTYSRQKPDGSYESWVDVVERVVNGMYSIQRDHCIENNKLWNDDKAQLSAQEAFDRMFHLKWTPSGRGLWLLGTEFIHERKVSEALQNCAFISTQNIAEDRAEIFRWFMEMLMLGVGVGSDVRGAGKVFVGEPEDFGNMNPIVIPDTREGWAESVKILINSYLYGSKNEYTSAVRGIMNSTKVYFDYSLIRAKGAPIKGFGGTSSGPEPLIKLHERVREYMDKNCGEYITTRTIVDICNAIGGCVVAGNVRRSAEIMFADINNAEFRDLKNYEKNPERAEIGWASNNSVFAKVGDDYSAVAHTILNNGEPGLYWLENAQTNGRMGHPMPDNAIGGNPCLEQPLAHKELCNLVEVYMNNHDDLYDYLRTLKFAYLYGKSMTLTYEWIKDDDTREIMKQNRRIGLSNTGIAQFLAKNGMATLVKFLNTGYDNVRHYDKRYSLWLGINESIRVTTVKPSGSVSLLAGATPGLHHPHSEYYIRRIRLQENTDLVKILQNAGFTVEKDAYSDNTMCAEFPVHAGNHIRNEKDLGLWQQFEIAAALQTYWSDNAVSVTIKIDPASTKAQDIVDVLDHYQHRLKGVSLLPEPDGGAYVQMPYEAISQEVYEKMLSAINLEPLQHLGKALNKNDKLYEIYCSNDSCEIRPVVK